MGIDGVRKSSPPGAPPANPSERSRSVQTDPTARPFELQPTPTSPGTAAVGPLEGATAAIGPVEGPPGPLAALRAGTVDITGYVNLKVNEATAHLVGMPPADLLAIRATIRERLATDPTLVDLVRTAAGSVPQPSDDD
jgi:hypothetical protein